MIDPVILASAVQRAKDELPCLPDEEHEAKAQIEALILAGEVWLAAHAQPNPHDTASYS